MRRPVALPPAWATRRRVWPPSRPSESPPSASTSKRTPSSSRSRTLSGASSTSTRAADGRTAPRPATSVSREVLLGRVVLGERGRQTALGPVAGGGRERRRADERDPRAGPRRAQRGVEAGGPCSDDGDVGGDGRGGRRHAPGTVTRCPRRSSSATRRPSTTTPGPHPEQPARIVASSASSCAAARARLGGARLLRRPARGARDDPSARVRGVHRAALPARRRADRPRHGGQRRVLGGGVPRRRAARATSSTSCSAATGRPPRRRRIARPATTPSAIARWASACSPTSRSPRSGRSTSTGCERVLDRRLGRPPRQRDERHLPRHRPRCCSRSIHEWPLYPGTGPASDVGSGRGEGYTVNLPVPPGPGTRRGSRSSSTSCGRSHAPTSRS